MTAHPGVWRGAVFSIAAHVAVFALAVYLTIHARQIAQTASAVMAPLTFTVVRAPGPDTGGGVGGPAAAAPPRIARAPQVRTPTIQAAAIPPDVAQVPQFSEVLSPTVFPGAVAAIDSTSLVNGGAGRGPGSGSGGDGPGVGPGRGGGSGGDVYGPGSGATDPVLIKEVKPSYTADAMRAKIQGAVEMDAVVRADGSVDPASIRVVRSLDRVFGLDEQAIIALRQWRFRPGTYKGQAVAVRVAVELTFTLR
jgi:protein TonB